MSWMDSWSRPTKHAATPPPLYLTSGGETIPYCYTCGRVISTRKSQTTKAAATPVKYCSDRCRHSKPSEAPGSVDCRISDAFVALLDGKTPSPYHSQEPIAPAEPPLPKPTKGNFKKVKGETRITVSCAEVEALVFGARHDAEKVFGRRKNRARRGVPDAKEWKTVDMEDEDNGANSRSTTVANPQIHHDYKIYAHTHQRANAYPINPKANTSALTADPSTSSSESEPDTNTDSHTDMINLRIRPPQSQSEVNGSIGGEKGWAEKIEESPEMLQKRLEGQKRADERELVRCAARRLCAFGVLVDSSFAVGGPKDKGTKGKGRGKGKGKAADGDNDDDGVEQMHRKKCEAVMSGSVVEASFAKGEWGIRWRE